jgi:hypothetical protein
MVEYECKALNLLILSKASFFRKNYMTFNDRFIALPVGQGDAFYLEKNGRRILFDGGRYEKVFPETFVHHVGQIKCIDIMVCSHADADHVNGLIGLLESNIVTTREVWLPGKWSNRIIDMSVNSTEFLYELAEDIFKVDADDLGELESLPLSETMNSEFDEIQEGEVEAALESECLFDTELSPIVLSIPLRPFRNLYLFIDAFQTAKRIRKLAKAAYHHGAQIKWFDYDEFQKTERPDGGSKELLIPVNSVESKPRKLKISAIHYLALSVANRQSLVFLAPETKAGPSVLFTADSDLRFSINVPCPSESIIVTSPHHGSESNSNAYTQIRNWMKSASFKGTEYWVRSDGNYKSRPGSSFKSLRADRRCTICHQAGKRRSSVVYKNTSGGWNPLSPPHACNC